MTFKKNKAIMPAITTNAWKSAALIPKWAGVKKRKKNRHPS
jgi:hypothetical protein